MAAHQPLPTPAAAVAWLQRRGARALASDSRRVRPGDAFIAWQGRTHDARRFVADALQAGAAACLIEAEGADAHALSDARIGTLRGLKAAAGQVASAFLGSPSERLDLLAVTGTNGKTSTAWWLAGAMRALGRRCGVIGTLGAGEPPVVVATGLTTPDPVVLQTALRAFVDAGVGACAIEASSIGLAEHRLAGCAIRVALFTNFSRDHLDHHATMDAYWAAKAALFEWTGLHAAVVNVDDARGHELAAGATARGIDVFTCSSRGPARIAAGAVRYRDGGIAFDITEDGASHLVRTRLIGEFNVDNLLCVIGGLRALGVPLADAAGACAGLAPVPGRMQRVTVDRSTTEVRDRSPEGMGPGARAWGDDNLPEVVVDYAHTPDALEKALLALRPFAAERGGKLWCVFGCGGNRDASKRPLMGAIAERLADHVVATSDNPRDEAPGFILSQILVGVAGHDDVDVIEDRAAAIAHAVAAAGAHDVLLIAGKGHEDYQEVGGRKLPFSDLELARTLLAVRAGGGAA